MARVTAYRLLCGLLGLAWLAAGGALLAMFLGYHSPGGREQGLFSTMGPQGHYLAAFAGCALVVWGLALLSAAHRPLEERGIAVATVVGLVLCAAQRMMAWVVGDYAELSPLLRVESAVFLVLALALVWLVPRRSPAVEGAP
jgi:hypothetical protein